MDDGDPRRHARTGAGFPSGRRLPGALRASAVGRLVPRGRDRRPSARRRPARPGCRTRRRRRASTAQLDGGCGGVLGLGDARRRGGADRALLRAQGGIAHPRDRQAEGVPHHQELRPDGVSPRAVRGGADRRARRRSELRSTPRRRADDRYRRHRPRRAGADRLHLGYHPRPEGRHPQSPDAGLRDATTAGELPAGPRQAADRHTRRPLHRHDRRAPDPGDRGGPDRSGRRVRARFGTRVDEVRRHHHRRRSALLRDQPAGPSGLHRRASGSHQDRRAGRLYRARRGHQAASRPGRVRLPVLRQHRAPVDHRIGP